MIPISVENLLITLPNGVLSKNIKGDLIILHKSLACKTFLANAPAYCPIAFDKNDNTIETIDNIEYVFKY